MHAAELVRSDAVLGESALWHAASGRLYWLDLAHPTLHWLHPASGERGRRVIEGRAPLGALALSAQEDHLVLVAREGVRLLHPRTGEGRALAHPLAGREGLVYNDAGVDAAGRLWVGTAEESETRPDAELFIVEPDGSWTSALQGLVVCNGPAFSPDGSLVYVSDTSRGVVRVYDVAEDGRPVNDRPFARAGEHDGLPDGLAVDAEGGLWAAHWGAGCVARWDPDGRLTARVELPTPNVTSVAFGGESLSQLYITTARDPYERDESERRAPSGSLFVVEPGIAGIPLRACGLGA